MAACDVVDVCAKGHNNVMRWQLTSDGVPVDLGGVTRMTLEIGPAFLDSQVDSTLFDWIAEAATGIVTIKPGNHPDLVVGVSEGNEFVVYDGSNPDGIWWARAQITVR